ncbi:GNAT family N-acetyltransferase [Rossellomorea vietnamensis]|uniref:GNAT family N-acetyltransferase n=1 Tax=Rossellomorea vietnamensis TaxID=218284 RepID=A0A5D4NH78_9BACI|nr:GNAT family N-acetyltransferase [Rossellomorea vietnamensis]TYS13320.1 GNAT family N-acetyltransferase [Rossellomorea vietnamensis]
MENGFNRFPVLETERLKLREIKAEDTNAIYKNFSDDRVTEYYDLETFTEVAQAEALIEKIAAGFKTHTQLRWAITLKHEKELIGTCGFHEMETEHFKVETGYELSPDYWGRGIMNEALNAIFTYAFEEMGVNRIEAFYDPANDRSRNALEKCGFLYEGTQRKRFFEKGRFVDASLSALLQEDYEK